ncbi:hypothetical protein ABT072_47845 [Streptomyces sp. NPDC002589]|uniref:hypothetical protein n=1 Tax=Streptomyces sp. NPDC002589 TaxID=3154420 RepID=UPI00332DAE36
MLHFEHGSTSGSAAWCSLRDAGPGRRPSAAELAGSGEEMFTCLGLDPSGSPAQIDPSGAGQAFTAFAPRKDRAGALLVACIPPGEHAAAQAAPFCDELTFSRWIDTVRAASSDAAVEAARVLRIRF